MALLRALALVGLVTAAPLAAARAQEPALGLLAASDDPCSECIERGVRLALDEAASVPGAHRLELRVGRVESPWLSSADSARDLVLEQGCVALLAPADRDIAHLAAQVATRLRVPIVALSGESTLTRAMSPWIFRLVPDDRAQVRALVGALDRKPARVAALVPAGRAGSPVRADLRFLAGELGIEFDPVLGAGAVSAAEVLAPLRERRDEPLLIWLPEAQSLPLLEAAGSLAWNGPVLLPGLRHGGPPAPTWTDLQINAVRLGGGRNPGDVRFRESFLRAFGRAPDAAAACAYDAATLLARAVAAVGADAEAIRGALAAAGEHDGASGPVRFDEMGNRLGALSVEPLPSEQPQPAAVDEPAERGRSAGTTPVRCVESSADTPPASASCGGRSRATARTWPGCTPAASPLASLPFR